MFKINNKDTRTTPWYLYWKFWTYFTPCSSVSIVKFEQANAGYVSVDSIRWSYFYLKRSSLQQVLCKDFSYERVLIKVTSKLWINLQGTVIITGLNISTEHRKMPRKKYSYVWWKLHHNGQVTRCKVKKMC